MYYIQTLQDRLTSIMQRTAAMPPSWTGIYSALQPSTHLQGVLALAVAVHRKWQAEGPYVPWALYRCMQCTEHGILHATREGASHQPAQLLLDRYRSKCCWMADKDHQQMTTRSGIPRNSCASRQLRLAAVVSRLSAAAADNLLRSCPHMMSSEVISCSSVHLQLCPQLIP